MTTRPISSRRAAFTLNELLIVIAIIILMLTLAVPAFNVLTGSKSTESAKNQISAMLGQARSEAIGIQEVRGVLFYYDIETDRINMAQVRVDFENDTTGVSYLDLVSNRDFLTLPPGVGIQTVDNPTDAAGAANDSYIGYNERAAGDAVLYGGVILFDAYGKLISTTYGFRLTNSAGTRTELAGLLQANQVNAGVAAADFVPPGGLITSQFGFVLFDREGFANASTPGKSIKEDAQINGTSFAPTEAAREAWITENASVVLVNRYNGTLIKAD